MKSISSVDQDILFNTRNNFIFPSIHVLFCLLYKNIVLLPHKNRAVYSDAFRDNRHIHVRLSWIITHVRWSILLVVEKSINHLYNNTIIENIMEYNNRVYTITWLLCAFSLVVDRDLLKDVHTDDIKSTPYHVSRLVFLFWCPKIYQ